MKGLILWLRVVFVLIAMTGHAAASETFSTLTAARPVPTFQLQDHDGHPFGPERLRDVWSLVFLGFTTCPDVCPITMMKLEAVRAELGLRFTPQSLPQVVFLAVDPARDKPVLAQYLAHFHPQNIGVTGNADQIDILAKALDGFYRLEDPNPGAEHYNVVHTAAIAVVSPRGEMVASMSPPFHVHPMAEFLTHLIRKGPIHE